MNIVMVGTGYVGLVTGVCFADMGHTVHGVDTDPQKVVTLQSGQSPIHEPGLDALIATQIEADRLHFYADMSQCTAAIDVYFIAVGTPALPDGGADLQYVESAIANAVAHGQQAGRDVLRIVVKSTVPVGTSARLSAWAQDVFPQMRIHFLSNPEFLKQGHAVEDSLSPDRVIVGVRDATDAQVMRDLYAPLLQKTACPFLVMQPAEAELAKYAANAFLATKISFVNELAVLCDSMQVDVEQVIAGMKDDPRISPKFLQPGCGYGGSCFPKDVQALVATGQSQAVDTPLFEAVHARNLAQKQWLVDKALSLLDGVAAPRVGVWGLAFKPETDDLREAPALVLIQALLDAGVTVQVYDPVALENTQQHFDRAAVQPTYCEDKLAAADQVDLLVVVTEWPEFQHADWSEVAKHVHSHVVLDGRNCLPIDALNQAGFAYYGVGRQGVLCE